MRGVPGWQKARTPHTPEGLLRISDVGWGVALQGEAPRRGRRAREGKAGQSREARANTPRVRARPPGAPAPDPQTVPPREPLFWLL